MATINETLTADIERIQGEIAYKQAELTTAQGFLSTWEKCASDTLAATREEVTDFFKKFGILPWQG